MNQKLATFGLLVFLGAVPAFSQDAAKLEGMLDNALKAYNAQDAKAFYADYAKSLAGIATDQAFNTMYKDGYMKDLGKFVSKTMVKEKSVVTGDFPLMVFNAKFDKNEKVTLSCNFTKEDGNFKIMQIRFDKQ
ncbi:MAG: hypothetical protein U0166_27625 [Acidobacteriota bacterium]